MREREGGREREREREGGKEGGRERERERNALSGHYHSLMKSKMLLNQDTGVCVSEKDSERERGGERERETARQRDGVGESEMLFLRHHHSVMKSKARLKHDAGVCEREREREGGRDRERHTFCDTSMLQCDEE